MSKENGVFKYFFRGKDFSGEKYCVLLGYCKEKNKETVLDSDGVFWWFPLSKREADGDIDWEVPDKIERLMLHMKKIRNIYAKRINTIAEKVKDTLYTGNEILRMSFYNGTLDRLKAKSIIEKTDRPLLYTYGLEYRHPTIHRKSIDKEKAYEIINDEGYLDIDFESNHIHLNAYSGNDMW